MGPDADPTSRGHKHSGVVRVAPSRRIAGWLPAGMLDWPGKVSATLYLSGCGSRCPYCHCPDLADAPHPDEHIGRTSTETWTALVDHVHSQRSWLDGVVVTGGEPTEDPDLISLLTALCDEGIPVKLDTNGSRPRVLAHALAEDLLSHVALDVKTVPERYPAATGGGCDPDAVLESVDMLVTSRVPHEFRTTLYPDVVTLDELPEIASRLQGGTLYALQQYRPERTLEPAAASTLPYFGSDIRRAAARCSRYLPTVARGLR